MGTNNGALEGGVAFVAGKVGQAFSFNGTDGYVEVPDAPSLQLTNEMTIEFWVKRQDLETEDYLINKGGDYTRGRTELRADAQPARSRTARWLSRLPAATGVRPA